MSPEDAAARVREAGGVPVARASLAAIKELHARCLAEEIPAAVRRPPEPGG